MAINYKRLKKISYSLEVVVVALAIIGLVYRATIYWMFPVPAGASYGTGDIIDFAFAVAIFLLGGLCAASAIPLNTMGDAQQRQMAFRPAVVGITSFVAYYFLHPLVPRLI